MSLRTLKTRLARLEDTLPAPACPQCGGVQQITFHDEYRRPDGTVYYDPPFPEPCPGCGGRVNPADQRFSFIIVVATEEPFRQDLSEEEPCR
jgi:hypothetical protein